MMQSMPAPQSPTHPQQLPLILMTNMTHVAPACYENYYSTIVQNQNKMYG